VILFQHTGIVVDLLKDVAQDIGEHSAALFVSWVLISLFAGLCSLRSLVFALSCLTTYDMIALV
jgi:uncharacterized MAPEG superfamily protein